VKSSNRKKRVVVLEPNFVEDFEHNENTKNREYVGRPHSLSEEKLDEMLELYYTKPFSLRQLGDMFGVSRMTVWRAVQTAEQTNLR